MQIILTYERVLEYLLLLEEGNIGMKKKVSLTIATVITFVAVIYMGFAVFFQSHFCFGTSIDGIDVGGCSVTKAEGLIRDEIANYSIRLIGRENVEETISGSSIGMGVSFDGEVQALMEQQNGFAWIVTLFQKEELDLKKSVDFDVAALVTVLSDFSFMQSENQTAPVDATYSEYTKEDGYILVAAENGTTIHRAALVEVVSNAVESLMGEVNLDENGCYVEPQVKDDDAELLKLIEELNQYAGAIITYDFGEKQEVLDGEIISTWLTAENHQVVVDEEAVLSYVKDLGSTYNTAYQPKELETSYGETVTISKGSYGWRIDNEAETAQILADIKAGAAVEREPVYAQTANSHGEHDYGDSYVEINLTAQHLFLYKDGELVIETDFVSGNVAQGHASPTGAYGVTYTTTNAVLRGDDYATPVNYWMPFAGDVGMHDATWRNRFGGNIYKTNGSHGCINLPYSAAQTIYNTIEKGYPVLVYYLPGTEPVGNPQQEAQTVIDLINVIGSGPITLESENAITTARNLYNALSDTAKGYVTNIDVLIASEAALAQLKAAAGIV